MERRAGVRGAMLFRPVIRNGAMALLLLCAALPQPQPRAETLPLPSGLVDLRGDQGQALLIESEGLTAFGPLIANFVTQKDPAYCGVASLVMVFNALDLPAPAVEAQESFHRFTQDNVLDHRTDQILPRPVLAQHGMTLDQLGALLATQPVLVEVHHAGEASLDAFREAARANLRRAGHFVIVNYLRKALGQSTGGHISPLAAYDAHTDRFLILDVSRYKYPPVWVPAAALFSAMNTADADNGGKTRGYVLIQRRRADIAE